MRGLNKLMLPILLFLSVSAKAQNKTLFESMPPARTGISFKNVITEDQRHNALTYENLYNGGGVAIGDINNDGLDDIYLISNMSYNKLYLNLGNFKFKDVTESAGVGGRPGWKTGVAMVDINGDERLDIYVSYSGKTDPETRKNQFFINNGNLTFEDQAQKLALDDPSYTTQVTFLDYDRDGDLDLFLLATNVKVIRDLEYTAARSTKHAYAGDKLFRNDGNKFTDVTDHAGILSNALGFGLGVAVSDINKDGWPDIYVSNDYIEPDYLYINNGNGTFTDRLQEYLQHISYFSMGSDIADINNDTWPDIYTVDMLPEDNQRQKLLYGPENYEHYELMVFEGFYHQSMRNMLHVNNANGTFSEIGQYSGVSNTDWSWAPLFADFDNDGWKDLFVTNGYFRDYTNRDFLKFKGDYYFQKAVNREKPDTLELVKSMTSTPVHNYIYKNEGACKFTDVSTAWGFEKKTFSNGAAYSDLDNDGDLDLVVNNQNAIALVYKNHERESKKNSHFLTIRLSGNQKNTRGWGSKVTVFAQGLVQYQEQMPVRGYQSTVTDKLHFGLGTHADVDSIEVIWPDGYKSVVSASKADQVISIDRNNAVRSVYAMTKPNVVFEAAISPIGYEHKEYGANDFKRQPLLMTMPSVCGPVLCTADVNGDGLTDVYVGGTKENPGKLFIQSTVGKFSASADFSFGKDFLCTDADALFLDADNDGDSDLYIASGGYHDYTEKSPELQDRLYINDGKGRFTRKDNSLPVMRVPKSCVRGVDFDQDGDTDLFIGGRIVPGFYPVTPQSYLLINDGKGNFSNALSEYAPQLERLGMITDAAWTDLNRDSYPDLIVTGEYMPVHVFLNRAGKTLSMATQEYFDKQDNGLWNTLAAADFDRDGDVDLLAGNVGLNSQLNASEAQPLTLWYKDFDKNGSIDPVLIRYIEGKPFPFASRDEMVDQVYALRKKFSTYASYANATLEDIFPEADIKSADKLSATELRTVYYENKGGKFVKRILPEEAQYAPVYAIQLLDYNKDGNLDFILAGNQRAIRIRLGLMDANYGQLFEGDGKGNFKYVPQSVSGLSNTGDVKSMKVIQINGEEYLLSGVNNVGVRAYKLRTDGTK